MSTLSLNDYATLPSAALWALADNIDKSHVAQAVHALRPGDMTEIEGQEIEAVAHGNVTGFRINGSPEYPAAMLIAILERNAKIGAILDLLDDEADCEWVHGAIAPIYDSEVRDMIPENAVWN